MRKAVSMLILFFLGLAWWILAIAVHLCFKLGDCYDENGLVKGLE